MYPQPQVSMFSSEKITFSFDEMEEWHIDFKFIIFLLI